MTVVDTRQAALDEPDAQSDPATTTVFVRVVVPTGQSAVSSFTANVIVWVVPASSERFDHDRVDPLSEPPDDVATTDPCARRALMLFETVTFVASPVPVFWTLIV